jgi:hypothetical protein
MRANRISVAAIIVTSFFLLALRESRYAAPAFGQALSPAAGPAVPSVNLPAAPGQPQAFATIGALPALLPAPGPHAFATATPASQAFRCACNGPGFPTSWMGPVSASNLLIAQQNAPGTCSAYLIGANAASPAIPPPSALFNPGTQAVTRVPGTLLSAPPGSILPYQPPQVVNHPPLSTIRQSIIISQCQRCSCS